MTTATVIPLASVLQWDQRRAEWGDVAWLAMRVHAGRATKGVRPAGVDIVDVEDDGAGEESPPPPLATVMYIRWWIDVHLKYKQCGKRWPADDLFVSAYVQRLCLLLRLRCAPDLEVITALPPPQCLY